MLLQIKVFNMDIISILKMLLNNRRKVHTGIITFPVHTECFVVCRIQENEIDMGFSLHKLKQSRDLNISYCKTKVNDFLWEKHCSQWWL